MSYGLRMRMEHRAEGSVKQVARIETQAKFIIAQIEKIRHPEIPNAERGIKGMTIADAMLIEHNCVGILIGGLAEEIHAISDIPLDKRLNEHKDVDVLIVQGSFPADPKFTGGIDWWLSHTEGKKGDEYMVGVNGFDAILKFGVRHSSAPGWKKLKPGLYIPSATFIQEMRMAEMRHAHKNKVREEVFETVRRHIEERMLSDYQQPSISKKDANDRFTYTHNNYYVMDRINEDANPTREQE